MNESESFNPELYSTQIEKPKKKKQKNPRFDLENLKLNIFRGQKEFVLDKKDTILFVFFSWANYYVMAS